MPVSVLVRGPEARGPLVETAVSRAYDELRRVDAVFSTYRPASEISRLRNGELALDECSAEVRDVLALCVNARVDTDGWFDHELPGHDGTRAVDPSGLVKGWAVERAAEGLASLEGHDYLLNAGGDVAIRSATSPFSVGIQSPYDREALIDVVQIHRGGVATSGSYARGGHILNPRTATPAHDLASASVIGPSVLIADVLATALYAEGTAGLNRIEAATGVEALIVRPDGAVLTTTNWPGRVYRIGGHKPSTHWGRDNDRHDRARRDSSTA